MEAPERPNQELLEYGEIPEDCGREVLGYGMLHTSGRFGPRRGGERDEYEGCEALRSLLKFATHHRPPFILLLLPPPLLLVSSLST